jgi:hypothetical protein
MIGTRTNTVNQSSNKRSYNSKRALLPTVKVKKRKIKSLDKPQFQTPITDNYIDNIIPLTVYRRSVGITPQALETLLCIHSYYKDGVNGVTVFMLSKLFRGCSDVRSELGSVNKRIVSLVAKGLICAIGKSDNNALLYVPTSKAIEDINNLRSK